MAQQHIVRALVPAADEATLRRELEALDGAGVLHIDSQRPPERTFRDAQPDRRLHQLWEASTGYLVVGAIGGAVLGVAVALLLPGLRDWLPWTALVLAFGFAWGGAAFGWGRGVQVAKREDDLGEEEVTLDRGDTADLRLLTVEVARDREKVADHLAARGATLLDSRQPVVGEDGGLARSDDDQVVPEGQRPGSDGHGGRVVRGRGSDDADR